MVYKARIKENAIQVYSRKVQPLPYIYGEHKRGKFHDFIEYHAGASSFPLYEIPESYFRDDYQFMLIEITLAFLLELKKHGY